MCSVGQWPSLRGCCSWWGQHSVWPCRPGDPTLEAPWAQRRGAACGPVGWAHTALPSTLDPHIWNSMWKPLTAWVERAGTDLGPPRAGPSLLFFLHSCFSTQSRALGGCGFYTRRQRGWPKQRAAVVLDLLKKHFQPWLNTRIG